MDIPVFDSRSELYKTPYGAVPCGTRIDLTLRPLKAEGFTACTLVIYQEFAGRRLELPLSPAGEWEDRSLFTVSYTAPEEPELIWYSFRFTRSDGQQISLDKNGASWQQTVYDNSLSTPDWFGRGVTYQIFPDRFCRSRVPDPTGMIGDRRVHENWEELMDYRPDEKGIIHNCDFFGGNLAGITGKLDYLQSLGVSTLYLCPIFESASNHRYDTGDYDKVDPMLGTEEDFRTLCQEAKKRRIRVMLDGVFNHTGNNSRYFNALGQYPSLGAAQSWESPYINWYTFQEWPTRYDSWWGIHTLPAVNENDPDYIDFIVEGQYSVIRRWLRAGAEAWRLDVADELPDEFIARIRRVMMEEKPESFLLGEVWEDGSNKISYDKRRRYLLGRETHGLMNYPFRVGAMAYLQGGDAACFREAMESIRENYPPSAFYSAMNMLGTHDNPRILTMLGKPPETAPEDRDQRAHYRLTQAERDRGRALLMAGAVLLYAFPGSPTIFYGDEAGMEGYEDPFNRGTFPWGREDRTLQDWFVRLGALRNARPSLQAGSLRWLHAQGRGLAFLRELEGERTAALINAGDEPLSLEIPWETEAVDALSGETFEPVEGRLYLQMPPLSARLLV